MIAIEITEPGPLTTVQDWGRFSALQHGVAASGPMDQAAFLKTADLLGGLSQTAIECAAGRLEFVVRGGAIRIACCGGSFTMQVNGEPQQWDQAIDLNADDVVEITPGTTGNYAYIRFDRDIDVPRLINSRSTNTIARLGGLDGRVLAKGDLVRLVPATGCKTKFLPTSSGEGPIRFIWGLHASAFTNNLRQRFVNEGFVISSRLDRMGVRLSDPSGVFSGQQVLSLVSDAVVPGDVQILGDGTPIVLMRDHQPTGGYPRVATIISSDLSRFAQMRPGTEVRFSSITVDHAHKILAEVKRR